MDLVLGGHHSAHCVSRLEDYKQIYFWNNQGNFNMNWLLDGITKFLLILLDGENDRSFFFKKRFYSFLKRGEGRKKEEERNINVWLPLVHPQLGTWPATQIVAWLALEPVTLWFAGLHSIHWATPVRAKLKILMNLSWIVWIVWMVGHECNHMLCKRKAGGVLRQKRRR